MGVLGMAKKLHHLLSDAELFEPLRSAAGRLGKQEQFSVDSDDMLDSERSVSTAMRRMGLQPMEVNGGDPKDSKKLDAEQKKLNIDSKTESKEFQWAPQKG